MWVQALAQADYPGKGNGNPLRFSCLGNPMDRAQWATIHGVMKSQTYTPEHTCRVMNSYFIEKAYILTSYKAYVSGQKAGLKQKTHYGLKRKGQKTK